MSLFDDIKTILRVSGDAFDPEVRLLIDACKRDMVRAGVPNGTVVEEGPLVRNAVACWCKANFGYDNPEAERFDRSYRQALCDLLNSPSFTGGGR